MDDLKSKSEKKREANTLQKVGVQLIELTQEKLDKQPLTPSLRQAIFDAKSIKSHGAKRRQAQLIGKLMRAADSEAILTAYHTLIAEDSSQTAAFHQAEIWRERLIQEGKEALTLFINQYHPADVQQLRQLIKNAINEQQNDSKTGAKKALFRFLRSCLS